MAGATLLALGVVALDAGAADPAQRLSEVPATRLDDGARAELDAPSPVSVSVSDPLPLRDALLLLFRGTAMSVVVQDGVGGAFVGELKNLTLRQALETVLFPGGLDYDVTASVVRVFARRHETRFFEIAVPPPRGSVRGDDAGDPAGRRLDDLEAGVRALLSDSGRSHLDRNAGLVQVTDFADRIERVAVYLESVDMRMGRQVRLAARIIEVTSAEPQVIDWAALAQQSGSGIRIASSTTAGVQVDDASALMRALGARGRLRDIAAPQLLATHNEPAVIRIGTEPIPVRVAAAQDEIGPGTLAEGLSLTVTAQIAADGIVTMTLSPAFAEPAAEQAGGRLPGVHVTRADTVVRVQDGRTAVISGLLRRRVERRQAGGLSGMPGDDRTPVYSEMVVLLTPTVVTPGGAAMAGGR